jgi:hypothetical protein
MAIHNIASTAPMYRFRCQTTHVLTIRAARRNRLSNMSVWLESSLPSANTIPKARITFISFIHMKKKIHWSLTCSHRPHLATSFRRNIQKQFDCNKPKLRIGYRTQDELRRTNRQVQDKWPRKVYIAPKGIENWYDSTVKTKPAKPLDKKWANNRKASYNHYQTSMGMKEQRLK